MKVSREWLQTYFESPLPAAKELADALTFHAFEIESVENDVLDVKVTPNRGHDCLSHRGIAKELSAILKIPMKSDPLREKASLEPKTAAVSVAIENPEMCPRFTAASIIGLRVGPSPEWLKNALEEIGQRSISNVVDATNYVMFGLGQPLHAFDASKLKSVEGKVRLSVRNAKKGDTIVGLDDKEYALEPSMLVIEDANAGVVASVAGIKGGKPTGIDESTTSLLLEAANWNGVAIRKASQALKLRTDASNRFEQVMSSEIAPLGLRACAELIVKVAGGKIVGYVDEYPRPEKTWSVVVATSKVNSVLGASLKDAEVADAFTRLDLPFSQKGDEFTVNVPFERLDLTIPEDLAEEVGRIVGYDKVPSTELPAFSGVPEVNANFYASEKTREDLISRGYSEVYTSVFVEKGERAVANKIGGEKPYLRATLLDGLKESLTRNVHNKDLLGLKEIRLFEIGTIWKAGKEMLAVGRADPKNLDEQPLSAAEARAYDDLPISALEHYKIFSRYPSIARDISLWVPSGIEPAEVEKIIRESAGELLQRTELFDRFEKGEKLSLAFRLVFQSFDRTLMDEDANARMESVYGAVKAKGWEVR
jgi:phenylalanyl-tRNA synthetase beta chain